MTGSFHPGVTHPSDNGTTYGLKHYYWASRSEPTLVCSICRIFAIFIGASLSEPHLVRTMISLSVYIIESVDSIIESVDSISRDELDVPLTQYITNT